MNQQLNVTGVDDATIDITGAKEWTTRLLPDGRVQMTLRAELTEPAAPEPDPAPLRIGFHPTPVEYSRWMPALPTPWFTRVFHANGKGLPAYGGPAITSLPRGTIPHISFKDRVTPAAISAFLDSIPRGVQVWLTWHHEGDIDWAKDVPGYVAYWKTLRQVVDAHPRRPDVTLINVHTQYPSRVKRRDMQWRDFMVPDYADVDSWDCYRPGNVDVYEAPETLLGLPAAAKLEFGTRLHITEFGSHPTSWDTDGAGQAQWYREACAYMAMVGVEAVGFWCNADGQYEYRPTKPRVLIEWKSLISNYNSTF